MQLFCMKLYILCIFYNNEIKVSRQHWGSSNKIKPPLCKGRWVLRSKTRRGCCIKSCKMTVRQSPSRSAGVPFAGGSQTKLQQPPLCKRRWHTVRCDGGIVPVIILNDLQIDRFATQSLSRCRDSSLCWGSLLKVRCCATCPFIHSVFYLVLLYQHSFA